MAGEKKGWGSKIAKGLKNIGVFLGVYILLFMVFEAAGITKRPIKEFEFRMAKERVEELKQEMSQIAYESVYEKHIGRLNVEKDELEAIKQEIKKVESEIVKLETKLGEE